MTAGRLRAEMPMHETFGGGCDILTHQLFGIRGIAAVAVVRMHQFIREANSADELKAHVDEFGDSTEKFYMYQRIAELERGDSIKTAAKNIKPRSRL